jgi:hypothetical protein
MAKEVKKYIFKKAYPKRFGLEIGDYYNGELGETEEDIKRLLDKGIIEEETNNLLQ